MAVKVLLDHHFLICLKHYQFSIKQTSKALIKDKKQFLLNSNSTLVSKSRTYVNFKKKKKILTDQ